MEIIPAIIAKTFSELKEKIKIAEPYVNWVQLDVMDGKFVPEKSWPYTNVIPAKAGIQDIDSRRSLSRTAIRDGNDNDEGGNDKIEDIGYLPKQLDTKLNLEAHLMVAEPEKEIEKWLNSGIKRILVHYEAIEKYKVGSKKLEDLFIKCSNKNIGFGVVLKLETPIDVLEIFGFLLHTSDFIIQLMSIGKIGYHGQPFDGKVIHKLKTLKQKWPNVKIAIDGGLNSQNVLAAAEVGADNLVIGSAIYQSQNVGETIRELKDKLKMN